MRYLNSVLSEKIVKNTGLSPFKMNIDWPSIKQLCKQDNININHSIHYYPLTANANGQIVFKMHAYFVIEMFINFHFVINNKKRMELGLLLIQIGFFSKKLLLNYGLQDKQVSLNCLEV